MSSPTADNNPTDPILPDEEYFSSEDSLQLNWMREDIERKFGFQGGRFTNVGVVSSLIPASIFTAAYFALLVYVIHPRDDLRWFSNMFLEQGIVPYPIVFFFFWGLCIMFIKGRKLAYQERALNLAAVPQEAGFTLNRATSKKVLNRMHSLVDNTAHFVILNRIERALSNLSNIGQISDVSSILRGQASDDEDQFASSYSLLRGFIWAVPVLGFIGTVIGLSKALGYFGDTLEAAGDVKVLKTSLKDVTSGLSTAFETTLLGLVAALALQMRLTFLQRSEYAFLDRCSDYCHTHVISKLKLG